MLANYTDTFYRIGYAIAGGTLAVALVSCSAPTSSVPSIGSLDGVDTQGVTREDVETFRAQAGSGGASAIGNAPDSVQLKLATDVSQQFYMAEIESSEAAIDFLTRLRAAAYTRDKKTLANMIHYPITVYDDGTPLSNAKRTTKQPGLVVSPGGSTSGSTTYENAEELLKDFDKVMTKPVLDAIINVKIPELLVTSTEVMIGLGEVSFAQYEEEILVKSIHHR